MRNPWLWLVGGAIGVLFVLYLSGLLSRPALQSGRLRVIDPARENLALSARLIDSVAVAPALLVGISERLRLEFDRVDSMIANGEIRDAVARLERLASRKITPDERAYVFVYIGMCENRLRDHSRAVLAFEQALPDAKGSLAARLAFNVGLIFQRYGESESAARHYDRALTLTLASEMDSTPSPWLPALLNNYGVAAATIGDTAKSRDLLSRAARYIDTTATDRDALRLRENLALIAPHD